jgi:hypothetical protein
MLRQRCAAARLLVSRPDVAAFPFLKTTATRVDGNLR